MSSFQASQMIALLEKIIEALDRIYHALRHEKVDKE